MKLLIFVDNHGSLSSLRKIERKAKKADLLIQAGDISIFEQDLDYLLHKLDKLKKEVLIIPGNHESEEYLKKACSFFKNITYFHKKIKKINNILFIGYGGGGFSLRTKEFEKFIIKNKKKIKGKEIVLIIHQPPHGAVDLVMKEHTGNKSFRDFINKYKPRLVVCGHLHENERKKKKIGKTLVINPGPTGKIINIT